MDYYMVIPAVVVIAEQWVPPGQTMILIGKQPQIEGKPYPGLWDLPGGKLEPGEFPKLGESPGECARRELLEETGYQADRILLFDVFHNDGHDASNNLPCLAVCYTASMLHGEFYPMELEDLHWVNVSKSLLKRFIFTPWTKHFLQKFIDERCPA